MEILRSYEGPTKHYAQVELDDGTRVEFGIAKDPAKAAPVAADFLALAAAYVVATTPVVPETTIIIECEDGYNA